jgi:hypothetical protein
MKHQQKIQMNLSLDIGLWTLDSTGGAYLV